MSVENVLARFQMPPKIAITQRPRREEKRVGEHVHFENRSESLVHEVWKTRRGPVTTRQFELGPY